MRCRFEGIHKRGEKQRPGLKERGRREKEEGERNKGPLPLAKHSPPSCALDPIQETGARMLGRVSRSMDAIEKSREALSRPSEEASELAAAAAEAPVGESALWRPTEVRCRAFFMA